MNKTWFVLTILACTALTAVPAMAAGPELAPTATPTRAATATPLPTYTPAATYTPFPTFTPLPTYTPQPTFTPVTQPTAAPTASPTAEALSGVEIGDRNGKVVFGGDYVLRSGEQLRGDLVVFGGSAQLEADSRVDGNVVVIGGEADIAGRVQGDVVVIGGSTRLRSTAIVDGQAVRIGGAFRKDDGAQIRGGETSGAEIPPLPPVPPVVTRPPYVSWWEASTRGVLGIFWHTLRVLGTVVALALLAVFVVALWREPVERVNHTITSAAGMSWLVGLLSVVTSAIISLPLVIVSAILSLVCIGLLGFGLISVAWLILALAGLMGWIVLGQLVGDRLLSALGVRNATPAAAAAAGTAVITLLWLGLEPFCGLGWLFFGVLAPLGLGAVLLTRFGLRDYTSYTPPVPRPPAPMPPAPAPRPPAPAPVAPSEPPAPEQPLFAEVTPMPDSTPSNESPASSEEVPPASPLDKPVGEL